MSDILRVVRADDLLVLRFEFVNLVLDPDEASVQRHLVRPAPTDDAFIVVHFPPQHIAEETFPPGEFSRNARSLLAGESRLGFRLPADVQSLPLTVDSLLDWGRFTPVSTEDDPDLQLDSPPFPLATAIELPYRVVHMPTTRSRWEHLSRPSASGTYVGLWHTRLVPKPGVSLPHLLVAVWSPDLPDFSPVENPFPMSLTHDQRAEIVQIASFSLATFRFAADERDLQVLFEENPDLRLRANAWFGSLSQQLLADQLMLSALGGWLRIQSRFDFPPIPAFLLDDEALLGFPVDAAGNVELFSLTDWGHAIVMGRDQTAQTVEHGFLYPFGHRASKLTTTERRFVSNGILAELEAYLFKRTVLVVEQPTRDYDSLGMPFTSVTITMSVTPDLGEMPDVGRFVPKLDGTPLAFPVRATDKSGVITEVGVPMVWVPADEQSFGAVGDLYATLGEVEFLNQSVAFARVANGSAAGRTSFKTVAMRFGHEAANPSGGPSFGPVMQLAKVHIPAVEELGPPTRQIPRIRFHDAYLAEGFAETRKGVFAEIVDGLPLELPADQAGGLLALGPPRLRPPDLPVPPGLKLTGLSVDLGAVPNVNGLANGFSSGEVLEGLGGRLLGVIDLNAIVAKVTGPAELPTIVTRRDPDGQRVTFTWTPRLTLPQKPLEAAGSPALTISQTLFRPGGVGPATTFTGPSAETEGTLTDVALSFFGVLKVGFSKLHFHTKTGQKPEFNVDIKSIEFFGDLAFVNDLARLLSQPGSAGGGDGGPAITLSPEAISAGLSLTVPTFSLGVFSLQNLAFSSTLTLFLSDKPAAVRFALSSRAHPFLVSYSVFGGGGHFALTAATDGTFDVEASLEFGASVSINLLVAEGTAQVMVGVAFSKRGDIVSLEGYIRIYGCLEILGIVSISVDFHLSLKYQAPNATGRASLTVSVRILAFSKSVTLTVERSFNMENALNRSFADALPVDTWVEYCDAFAPVPAS